MKKPHGQTRALKNFIPKAKGYPLHDELWYAKAKQGYAIGSGDLEIGIINLDAMSELASMEYARDICAAYNAEAARKRKEGAK